MPLIAVLVAALLALLPATSRAAKACFLTSERIHYVQDVQQIAPDGHRLALARKYTEYCLLLPAHFRDDGYVLMEAGNYRRYYPLTSATITSMQNSGGLPNPLPDWNPSLLFVLYYGYPFWFLLAAVVLYAVHGIRKFERERRQA